MMDISSALPTFVITLREGVEAALVVGIVLALLQKSHQSSLKPWVYAGVGVGMMASIVVGALLNSLLQALQQSAHPTATILLPFLKLSFTGVAIAMLTWMLIWMTRQARTAKAEIEGAVGQILQTANHAGWGIWTLVFVAVLREGLETALFIVAQLQEGWAPLLGAVAGLLGATGIGWVLFAVGIRINLQRFFQIMGILLLLIVGGLVLSACKQIDGTLLALNPALCFTPVLDANTACILGPLLWDAHHVLPDGKFPGILLKTFLGYRDHLFLGQAMVYLLFLGLAGGLYGWSLRPLPSAPTLTHTNQTDALPKESP
jgi:high-affinity iron transporter